MSAQGDDKRRLPTLDVRQRILAGLLVMLLLVLAAAFAAGFTATRLSDSVQGFHEDTVPALDQAGNLARLGLALDVATRALVTAESQFELDAETFQLRQLNSELRAAIKHLPSAVADHAEIPQLLGYADEFEALLAELEPQVESLIASRSQNAAALAQIHAAEQRWATQSSAASNDASALLRSTRMFALLMASLATDDPALARNLQTELRNELAYWQAQTQVGSPLANGLHAELARIDGSVSELLGLRLAQLRTQFRIRQLQNRGKSVLEGIGQGARSLAAEVRETLALQATATQKNTRQMYWMLAVIGLGSVAGAFWISHDLTRKVIHRLERLGAAMRAHVEGKPQAIDIEGVDEIARMARAVDHFVREIGQREIAAQAAHAHLMNTQQQLVLQEKMASLGTLTAGVAHEINNPTNFADGAVQNLEVELQRLHSFLRELAGEDASGEVLAAFDLRFARLAEMAGTAREGHERIKRIVRDLRQFTRLDEAERKRVALAEPITATVNLVRTRFDRIRFDLDLSFNPMIECQPAKLGQVFMNLIVNACDAIAACDDGRRGEVRITTRSIDQDSVTIAVTDNGMGMSETIRERIFEPFYTTKGVGAGTGLGLAIVFGIVKDHGGRIEVSSQVGQGSCFTLCLPISS